MDCRTIPEVECKRVFREAEAGQPPVCPECKKLMQVLMNEGAPRRPEAYCGDCHLSIPLWR